MGAVHSAVFAGFSPEAVADRIVDCGSRVVVTADAGMRGGKPTPLKSIVDTACGLAAARGAPVRSLLVTHRAGGGASPGAPGWVAGRDVSMDDGVAAAVAEARARGERASFPPASMGSEDPLFILYTSGSTGKPKGVVHTTAGYLLYAALTHKYVFDVRPGDVYACVADCGWITGHSYIIYGPLANGATTLMFESTPMYPDASRYWHLVETHKVTQFYTAPTAIRALMRFGEEPVRKHDLSSLRVLGSVGEPINPEAWRWYFNVVGRGNCSICDTYWQTVSVGRGAWGVGCDVGDRARRIGARRVLGAATHSVASSSFPLPHASCPRRRRAASS
jgi:acetyl-CoA synthetase